MPRKLPRLKANTCVSLETAEPAAAKCSERIEKQDRHGLGLQEKLVRIASHMREKCNNIPGEGFSTPCPCQAQRS